GRKHLILKYEVVRIFPVVGNLTGIVVPHDFPAGRRLALDTTAAVRGDGFASCALSLFYEPIHLAAVDVSSRVLKVVRSAPVLIVRGVKRLYAHARYRIRRARGVGYPVGPR